MRNLLILSLSAFLFISCQQVQETPTTYHKASIFPTKNIETEQKTVWLESLITSTPQEGRELAIKMARQTIGAVQSDAEIKKKLREKYAEDYAQLINISKVVAIEFQTIAEANNYWRK